MKAVGDIDIHTSPLATISIAPLADFTDAPFRRMCVEGGADATYTEMVSAAALYHGHAATRFLLETLPGEPAPVCQLFGSKEEELAFAVREIERLHPGSFSACNLNAGCPMQKVTRSGSGAALASDPAKVHRLLVAMKENTSLPVTLKTRLGPSPACDTADELLSAAESAGAAGIIFHARYTSQLHGGEVNLKRLASLVRRSSIPVTGNGSVRDAASFAAMAATGVAGVMIGRAALGDPYIFARLKDATFSPAASNQELARRHVAYIMEFMEGVRRKNPPWRLMPAESYAVLKLRTHIFRYFSGQPGAAALRARFNSIKSLSDFWSLCDEM